MDLTYIRDSIEKMDHHGQLESLRILNSHKEIVLNENKFGVHVNLSEISQSVIDELQKYIEYVTLQERAIASGETEKERVGADFLAGAKKD